AQGPPLRPQIALTEFLTASAFRLRFRRQCRRMRSTPFVACVLALSLALGVAAAPSAAAAPCWQRVIADWSKDTSIDGRYPASCYRQAMQNAPTDLKIYSTLENDLQRALAFRSSRRLAAVHAPAAALDVPGGSSSSFSFLVALIAGLGTLLAACTLVATLTRRRRPR